MEIILLTVGKTTVDFVKEGIEEYLRRLKRYVSYKIVPLPDIRQTRTITPDLQKEKEGETILQFLSPSDFCVLLDERGRQYTSVEFSSYLQKIMASGRKKAVFVVGGPYGFSKPVYDRADAMLSLSKMTFTHEMIRLFFTEQVYRAMTILKGEPYHHE
jgi:23S rRNA (pseudouridine1915-N3)-methyltransferase